MTPQEDIARGNAAKRILDDPLYQEAFAEISAQLFKAFNEPNRTAEDLERLYISNALLTKIKAWLEGKITRGSMAAFEIKKGT